MAVAFRVSLRSIGYDYAIFQGVASVMEDRRQNLLRTESDFRFSMMQKGCYSP